MLLACIAVVASGITLMLTANAAARYTGNPLLRLRWIGLLGVGSGVSNVYFLLMPMCVSLLAPAPAELVLADERER
jgi:hypothetical protein